MARTVWRGRETNAAWVRPSFYGLLLLAGVLYVWDLGASGYANAFYSAAAQAGASNWEAFLYGSSDAGNSITVDKPPAAIWVMALSVRLFGLSSWSILLPEALMGVLTVALVYAIVRRHFGPQAALIAGGTTALTPVAVLMFRFNNPDALLLLLITAATYCTLHHIEDGRWRWLIVAGTAVGFGFLTKELQAFLILPVLAGVVLFASPRRIGVRLLQLLAALGALLVSAGWWVAIVTLVPASMRPYIGGSQTNSFLELTFGYNGFGRLTGNETGSVVPGGSTTGAGSWGTTGISRLFGSEFGTQISWLLPAALVLLPVAVVVLWRRPRVDPARATVLLLGGTLLVTGAAFSFGAGIIHPYYSVALAPAVGGLVGSGSWLLWQHRHALWARIAFAIVVLLTAGWAFTLMTEASTFLPWLRIAVATGGILAAIAILAAPLGRHFVTVAIVAALVTAFAAPTAWSLDTTLTAHSGSLPTAGPSVSGSMGGGPGGTRTGTQRGPGGAPGAGGKTSTNTGGGPRTGAMTRTAGGAAPDGTMTGTGGMGGASILGGGGTVDAALTTALKTHATAYTWVAATVGSQNAASYQLASGEAVMTIGGFNGTDPSPTLAQFKQDVAEGKIHYFIGSSTSGNETSSGSNASSQIATWVASHYTATTIGGSTVYDLTAATE